jgi:hypothetical protein
MAALQVLYAENNLLGGSFPDISRLVSLEAINLSDNTALQGSLPATVPSRLKDLRASKCALTGSVSSALMRSATLQSLLINGNRLTGPVPDPSSSIKVLDISNNQFGCFAPSIANGVNAKIDNNKFLCLPGVERVVGCAQPQLQALAQLCSGPQSMTCSGMATMKLEASDPPAVATLTIDSTLSLQGCSDIYCYLGQEIQGVATLVGGANQVRCTVKPVGVGVFSLSLRRLDGVVLSAQSTPVTMSVTAGCGAKLCSPPNGACTANGCVCNSVLWTGVDCDKKICPRNCLAASNQGVCDTTTGVCSCRTVTENGITWTWGGSDCSIKSLQCKGTPECSGRGACVRATGKCNCQPQTLELASNMIVSTCTNPPCIQLFFTGDACEKVSCPQRDGEFCSGHGQCDANTFNTPCACANGARGYDCSIGTYRCDSSDCNLAQSRCDTFTGNCICAAGILPGPQRPFCNKVECPTTTPSKYVKDPVTKALKFEEGKECSGHGRCQADGTCQCETTPVDYSLYSSCGQARLTCKAAPSNGLPCGGIQQGYCVPSSGECRCVNNAKRAYSGESCDTLQCPSDWKGCSPCDSNEPCAAMPDMPPAVKGECKFREVMLPGSTNKTREPYCDCVPSTATTKGRAGLFCQEFACVLGADGSECNIVSGEGTCDRGSGICICSTAGVPLDPKKGCSTLLCPGSNGAIDCSGNGECNGATAKCTCNKGAGGDACDQEVEDPLAIGLGVAGAIVLVLLCAVLVFCCLRRAAINKLQQH